MIVFPLTAQACWGLHSSRQSTSHLPSLLRSDKIFFSLYKVGLYSSLISDVFVARLYLCLESGAISIGVDR